MHHTGDIGSWGNGSRQHGRIGGRVSPCCGCQTAVIARTIETGEIVDLEFVLNTLEIRVRAAVRNRRDARYGFEFLTLSAEQRDRIEAATRVLAASPEEN